jgi:hypothetical protein
MPTRQRGSASKNPSIWPRHQPGDRHHAIAGFLGGPEQACLHLAGEGHDLMLPRAVNPPRVFAFDEWFAFTARFLRHIPMLASFGNICCQK